MKTKAKTEKSCVKTIALQTHATLQNLLFLKDEKYGLSRQLFYISVIWCLMRQLCHWLRGNFQ